MIIEIITFRLAEGADEEAFIQADHRVQTEFIPNHPGFMRRTTGRNDEGWVVVVLWDSLPDAQNSMRQWDDYDVVQHHISFMEPSSLWVRRYIDLGG